MNLLALVRKHYPGGHDHDQKNHGRRGVGTTDLSQYDPEFLQGVRWHGTPNGEAGMKVASYGIHVGTYDAATEALEARIGKRPDGKPWDGTMTLREAGREEATYHEPIKRSGYGWDQGPAVRWEDQVPGKVYNSVGPVYSDGSPISLDARPAIIPVRIIGPMTNAPQSAHEDFKANGYMTAQLKRGYAKSGYYYRNVSEDEGSISAVVPSRAHLQTYDEWRLQRGVRKHYPGGQDHDQDKHGRGRDRVWLDSRLGKETVGEFIDRRKLETDGEKVILYHGRPKGGTFTVLREGSYLADSAEDAYALAAINKPIARSKIEVFRLVLDPDDIQPGMHITLRREFALPSSPIKKHTPGGHEHNQKDHGRRGDPVKTVTAYKLFRVGPEPGQLFPLFIGAKKATPQGVWVEAEAIPTKGFASRPGWHAGHLPIAPHLRTKAGQIAVNRVWAEVEMPDDVDWQSIASATKTKDIRDMVPAGGHYKFKTSKMQGGAWMIGGSIKIKRILTNAEVGKILTEAGFGAEAAAEQGEGAVRFFERLKVEKHAPGGHEHNQKDHGRRKATSYRGGHQPTSDYGAPAHDLTQIVPEDIYEHPEWYGGQDEYLPGMAEFIRRVRGRPDMEVTIYRAVPRGANRINPGDWVTPSLAYAQLHADMKGEGEFHVIKTRVRVGDLVWPGDYLPEWGWFPKSVKKHHPGGHDHNQDLHGRRKGNAQGAVLETPTLEDFEWPSMEAMAYQDQQFDASVRWFKEHSTPAPTEVRAEFNRAMEKLRAKGIDITTEPTISIAPDGWLEEHLLAQTRQDFRLFGNVGVARHQIDVNASHTSPLWMRMTLSAEDANYRAYARDGSRLLQSRTMEDIFIHELGHVIAGSTGYYAGGGKMRKGNGWGEIWLRWIKDPEVMRLVWGRYATKDREEFYAEAFLLWVKDDPIVTPDVANYFEENVLDGTIKKTLMAALRERL